MKSLCEEIHCSGDYRGKDATSSGKEAADDCGCSDRRRGPISKN